MRKKQRKRDTLARSAMKLLCTLLGIILALMLAVTWGFQQLLDQINTVPRADAGSVPVFSLSQDSDRKTASALSLLSGQQRVVNILLIGQDARPGWGRSRSDSMILCTFDKEKKTITMTSFLRDLYVQIPGYQNNRINAAYPAGGMELLNETLVQNFGVHVDGNVEVDFSHFVDVIDLLGGVDIELRSDEAHYINSNTKGSLTEGMQHLNGKQALYYSRIRYLDADADFSRTNRQRKVISALIEKFRDSKLTTLLGLLDDLLPMVTTDMSNKEMISLATDLFPMLADCTIVSQRIPQDDTYHLAMIRGMSVIVADMDAQREFLKNTLAD